MADDLKRKYFESGRGLFAREYPSNSGQRKTSSLQTKKQENKEKDLTENFSSNCDINSEENEESTSQREANYPKKQLFKDMKIHPNLLNALQNLQYITANQVQIQALSFFSECTRESLKIFAPRKCGKTTAVFLCILNELLNAVTKKYNQALILCPTLELAEMCYLCAQQLTEFCPLTLCLAVKGKTFNKSEKITENIIIATPDKASEIILSLDFNKIRYLFIDDADCLKNSRSQFKIFAKMCKKLLPRCRIIVTTDSESQIVKDFFKENIELYFNIEIKNKVDCKNIKQVYVVYNNYDEKLDALVHFTARSNLGQTVIFCETTDVVVQFEELLQSKNIRAVKLFGGLSSAKRMDVLKQFKNKEIQILITTQAFLRVIPSDHITQVINVEQLFQKEGLLLEEYEKRRFLLNEKNVGTFVSLVDEKYKNFFFKKTTKQDERIFYNDAEIMTVEHFKNL